MNGFMKGESFAFEGTKPVKMRYRPLCSEKVRLYSLTLENKTAREYVYGKDFSIDREAGEIYALAGGTLPDRRSHAYYGHVPFDHEAFPLVFDYPDYVVYADYEYDCAWEATDEALARGFAHGNGSPLENWLETHCGKQSRMLLFGDSITEGLDCVRGLRYFERLAGWLQEQGAEVKIVNRAIGGECSRDGLRRLDAVAKEESDLTILAYGMNDQNFHDGANGISPEEYEKNIRAMGEALEKKTENIVLVSPALCHGEWVHRSPNVGAYAEILGRIAKEKGYAFADVTGFWKRVQSLGKTDACMLANGINHPSAYGHLLYFYVIKALLEGAEL